MTVGILAYGSVINDPGDEIKAATVRRIEVTTPFKVEFARASTKRSGAPTLVPVEEGGAQVKAAVIVVNANEADAASMLWRRERNRVGSGEPYAEPKSIGPDTVVIRKLAAFEGIDVVVYTRLAANIEPLNAKALAARAVESARKLSDGRDGITYLINAKACGIKTALSEAYEEAIKAALGVGSLDDALKKARARA